MIILTVLIPAIILASCENITSQDINADDLENILSVLIKDGDDPTLPAQPDSADSATAPETNESTVEAADITEITEITEVSEATTNRTPVSAEQNAEMTAALVSDEQPVERALSDAVKDFPDMPDAFKYVPFPNTLTMDDSLKQAIRNLDSLLKKDYEGGNFYAAISNPEFLTPILGNGSLNDARYYRTRLVETAYNTKLQSIFMNKDEMYTIISNSVKAGEYVSDIVCAPLDVQSLFIQDGILVDLRKIPFMNLNADYYNKYAVSANTVNGAVYGVASDLFFDPSKIYAVFYNKNLLKDCGLTNLDELYESGKWSYDDMLAICKTFATNVDTAANDLFSVGLSLENNDIVNGMYIPAAFLPVAGIEPADIALKIQDTVFRIFDNTDHISPLISDDDEKQRNTFSKGSMLFAITTLDIIPEITNSSFDWGVLPIPDIYMNQTYLYPSLDSSFTKGDALCLSVLKDVRNTEKCGIMIEALSIASHDYMREIYVSDLMTYHLRDMTSVNVVDKLLENIMYKKIIE